jgi:hypothetical protein
MPWLGVGLLALSLHSLPSRSSVIVEVPASQTAVRQQLAQLLRGPPKSDGTAEWGKGGPGRVSWLALL